MPLRQPLDALDKACLAATRAPWSSFAPTWKLDLSGDVALEALQQALDWTLARTPWPSASVVDGHWVVPEAPRLLITPADDEQAVLDGFLDLATGPALEVRLLRGGEGTSTLLFHQHHALADGRAFLELLGDFFAALRAVHDGARVPPLPSELVPRRRQAELVPQQGLSRALVFVRGAIISLSELARAVLRPVAPLPSNTGADYTGENRTVHLEVPLARLEGWRAARTRLGLSGNDLLAGALLWALTRWSDSSEGPHTLLFPIDVRPREGFRSFANHLSNLQLRWRRDRHASVVAFAQHVHEEATRQLEARWPWLRVLFDAFIAKVTPVSTLQRALLDERRLVTNVSFSNLLPLGTPGADATGRWRTSRCVVERLRITTPCVPPQGLNLTVARSGDAACFNFNFKASAVEERDVQRLVERFREALGALDETLGDQSGQPTGREGRRA